MWRMCIRTLRNFSFVLSACTAVSHAEILPLISATVSWKRIFNVHVRSLDSKRGISITNRKYRTVGVRSDCTEASPSFPLYGINILRSSGSGMIDRRPSTVSASRVSSSSDRIERRITVKGTLMYESTMPTLRSRLAGSSVWGFAGAPASFGAEALVSFRAKTSRNRFSSSSDSSKSAFRMNIVASQTLLEKSAAPTLDQNTVFVFAWFLALGAAGPPPIGGGGGGMPPGGGGGGAPGGGGGALPSCPGGGGGGGRPPGGGGGGGALLSTPGAGGAGGGGGGGGGAAATEDPESPELRAGLTGERCTGSRPLTVAMNSAFRAPRCCCCAPIGDAVDVSLDDVVPLSCSRNSSRYSCCLRTFAMISSCCFLSASNWRKYRVAVRSSFSINSSACTTSLRVRSGNCADKRSTAVTSRSFSSR
eukprot:PhM_4_TR13953/c0_g1_i2/m.32126